MSKIKSGLTINIEIAANAKNLAPNASTSSAVAVKIKNPIIAERMTCGKNPDKIVYVPITKIPSDNVKIRGNFKIWQRYAVTIASKLMCEPLTDKI